MSLAACGAGSTAGKPGSPQQPEPVFSSAPGGGSEPFGLTLMGWPFRPDLLRERLTSFEELPNGARVTHEQALRDYGSRAFAALTRNPPVDVVQVREGLAGAWRANGAVRPLGDEQAWQSTLDAMWPHARAAMVTDGTVVGLPFYSDVMVLAYNKRLLDRIGAPVPTSLDELTEVSLAATRQRVVEFPISLNLAPKAFANLPWWGLVFAAGGSLQRPDRPDPAAVAVLEWLRTAIAVDRIVDPTFLESTYETLALQKHVFSIVGAYMLRKLNAVAPGTFDLAPVPGIGGPLGTVAWTPFYAVNAAARRPELAIELTRFLGGRDPSGAFGSAAFWLRHEGLIPAYPSVLRDPQAQAALATWLDPERLAAILPTARPLEGLWAPWFLDWEHELQRQVQAAIFDQVAADEALEIARQRALELSAS